MDENKKVEITRAVPNGIVVKIDEMYNLFRLDENFKVIDPFIPISDNIEVYKDFRDYNLSFVQYNSIDKNNYNIKDLFVIQLIVNEREIKVKDIMALGLLNELVRVILLRQANEQVKK